MHLLNIQTTDSAACNNNGQDYILPLAKRPLKLTHALVLAWMAILLKEFTMKHKLLSLRLTTQGPVNHSVFSNCAFECVQSHLS